MSRRAATSVARSRGFTLVEILVALLVMAVLSVLAYNAFDGILLVESRSKEEFLAENRRNLAASIILNDFLHMRARPARDELGGVRNAYLAPSNNYAVEFSRGGLPDFPTMAGGVQRVAYRAEGGQLIRTTWQRLDSGPAPSLQEQVIATGITGLEVEHLDSGGDFIPLWPPLDGAQQPEALPRMVRVRLRLDGDDELAMLIPGPDAYLTAYSRGGD